MAVTANTAVATPVVGAQTTCGTIAGGPFDNVSVYFSGGTGGGNGPIALNLFATVNGILTLVATALMQGNPGATLVEFQLVKTGEGDNFFVNAGGSAYTVTIQDMSSTPPVNGQPRLPVTITIAGVDTFDTAPDAQQGVSLTAAPGVTVALTTLAGYAQEMDVAIDQTNIPPSVTVQVLADCGVGSVQAIVASVVMAGTNSGVGGVFRNLVLPVATRYIVQFTNNGPASVSLTLTATTYSESVTAGGVVILNGDVIGPSNTNTVIKWDNVPLLLGAVAGSFDLGQLPDAAVPIFDIATGEWRAFALSGGATMDNLGVVTIAAGSIALLGNTNGPANANTAQDFTINATNADVAAGAFVGPQGETSGSWYVGFAGLTANRMVTIPDMPSGSKVTVKDEDGSLGNGWTITIVSATGKTIDTLANYVMTFAQNGSFGAVTVEVNGRAPTNWQVV